MHEEDATARTHHDNSVPTHAAAANNNEWMRGRYATNLCNINLKGTALSLAEKECAA